MPQSGESKVESRTRAWWFPPRIWSLSSERNRCSRERSAGGYRCSTRGRISVATVPVKIQDPIRFGDGVELDAQSYKLRRAGRVLKLERIPLEILLLLVEQRGQIIAREHIVERVWGKGAFLDTDNSINSAIRKIRQVLKDDAEQPRFIQTITGQGYRFIAPVADAGPGPAFGPEVGLEDGKRPVATEVCDPE